MIQVIDRPPSFGEQLGKALGGGLGGGFSKGIDFAQELKLQKAKQKTDAAVAKQAERQQVLQNLDHTINQMESMIPQSGVGRMGQFNPSEKAAFNRGRMKTLSSELLSYYKTLFPRGITQEEFKRLERDYIPSEWDREETIRGKLQGFRDLIQTKLLEAQSEEEAKPSSKKGGKTKFNPKNPEHMAKFNQLDKELNGDQKKVNAALAREFSA